MYARLTLCLSTYLSVYFLRELYHGYASVVEGTYAKLPATIFHVFSALPLQEYRFSTDSPSCISYFHR